MIREQFVNFDIAKRLHELGFSTVTDDRANLIIDAFDRLPTVSI